MSTSRTTMKDDRRPSDEDTVSSIVSEEELDNDTERPLDIPFSFNSGPTIRNSQFTMPAYQDEGSIDPDTLKRPKDTFISFGNRAAIYNSNFTTNLPPTGTSETAMYTPAGEHVDPESRRRPNNTFVQFDKSGVVNNSTFSQFGANSQVFVLSQTEALSNGVASPVRGFHAWNESEKINALTAVHSVDIVIQAIIRRRSNNGDDDVKLIRASLTSYLEFVDYLVESKLPERIGSLQARAICLVVLAGVAIFLGVVQLLALALMSVMATGRNNSSTVSKVINIFAFCGISFDTLGAMFALWTFRSLILTISKIEKIVFEKQDLNAKIQFTLDTFRRTASPPQGPSVKGKRRATQDTTLENLVSLFADFQKSSARHHREAREVVHLIDDHLPVQEDCITLAIIAAGLLFFFVSLFSFIISSQPLSVWATTTVVVAVTFIILRINLSHQQPGSWRFITWKVRTTITRWFPLKNTRASGGVHEPDDV